MWSMLQSKISTKNINALLLRGGKVIGAPDSTEFLSDGKTFFKPYENEENNLDLLKQIHLDLWPEISQRINFNGPVIDDSYLFLKSPGGVETKMHQDRVYWEREEAEPSITSVRIALEDLTPAKVGLLLSRENEVKIKQWTSFNSGSILNHEEPAETSSSSFTLLISQTIAEKLSQSMEFIPMRKGQGLAFDSFEPHIFGTNQTDTPHLVITLAYAEAQNRKPPGILISLDGLEAI